MADIIDPSGPPLAAMSRRAFVAFSAGAVAAAASIERALADSGALGAPHPPLVSDDDPAIVVAHPHLDRPGGSINAYAAVPANAPAATPGIVVVQHIWGVDAQIRDVVRRFAKSGFATIAPDLYSRQHAPSGDGATDFSVFVPYAQALVDDQVDGDLVAAYAWIRTREGAISAPQSPKVGITGFCMGGTLALRNAADSQRFAAAAIWYGKIRRTTNAEGAASEMSLAYAEKMGTPLCGSFGARDTSIPAADVAALRVRLKVPNDLKVYDEAGHAFFDDTRSRYVASAAADSWTRTLAWFRKYVAT